MAGALVTDRDTVLRSCLRALDRRYRGWGSAAGEPAELAAAYRERCVTLGSEVSVALPDGGELAGTAVRIDAGGRLVVADPRGEHAVASGDVVHVRPMA
jgi:BirA family biotin operon repressor/biotin-[acetyl-CoA-carboxylase] ligase